MVNDSENGAEPSQVVCACVPSCLVVSDSLCSFGL